MMTNRPSAHIGIALGLALFAWSAAETSAAPAEPTPHGGQMSAAGQFRYEVVYRPLETRVYLYDASNRPVSSRDVTGKASMTVQGNQKVYQYDLTYAAPLGDSVKQDHLALAVNLGRIPDGRMSVTIELGNLPSRQQSRAAFTQTFALAKLPVSVVATADSDRAAIAQQKVCPVMDAQLGSMGTPVKVLVGDRPVYLCCIGCLGKIQRNPEAYLPSAAQARSAPGESPPRPATTGNHLAVSTSTSADRAAIARQGLCAVAGSRLGAMGAPVKVTRNGQALFLCCKGCVGKVEKNPDQYFAKAAELSREK